MGKIIVFANQKGGVGKTTSAVNIGAYLAEMGKKVLLIDFDSQANCSSNVGADNQKPGIYEVITAHVSGNQAVQETAVPGLSIIPSSINLSGATVELADVEGREYYLKKALDGFKHNYDYILIDCPPSLGILTINGLAAANYVLIPLQCEYFALEGLNSLLQTIKTVQQGINPDLQIGGILFTMYDTRTRLAHEVVQEVTQYFKDKVFRTVVPRNVRLSEAPSYSVPINKYDPDCIGAVSYKKLAEEVVEYV
ncbi:MAG: AAA family ATPase [Spirochaetia bacterium]|jgi:chromosome partitioning protein